MWQYVSDALTTVNLSSILVFLTLFLISIVWILRPKSAIPGPTPWPLFGNLFTVDGFLSSAQIPNRKLFKKYGPIFTRFNGPYQIVYVSGYSNVVQVLKNQGGDFIDRPNWVPKLKLVGRQHGIAWSNGETWKRLRRFTLRTLRDFGVGKTSVEEKILLEAQSLIETFEHSNGKPVSDIKPMMLRASCNVIHNIIFGKRYNHDDSTLNTLIQKMDDVFTGPGPLSPSGMFMPLLLLNVFLQRNQKQRNAGKYIREYMLEQTEEHRQTFDNNNIRDFVDVYIQAERESEKREVFGNRELFTTIEDLFGAGTDTTATTLHWALLYMIEYPDVQQRCQNEITANVGNNRMIRSADKSSLPYVQATLLEIQRMANTAVGTLPRMAVRDTTINGFNIPKGAIVFISLESVHEDREIWNNPEKFDPERFLDKDEQIIKKDLIMPFSTGSRNCMGDHMAKAELFLIFTNLLQKLTFSKENPTDVLSFQGTIGITNSAPPYKLRATVR